MDTIGPTLWQVVLSLHGDYMIVGVEAPVRFLNMVWGEVGSEMECHSLNIMPCGASRRVL